MTNDGRQSTFFLNTPKVFFSMLLNVTETKTIDDDLMRLAKFSNNGNAVMVLGSRISETN